MTDFRFMLIQIKTLDRKVWKPEFFQFRGFTDNIAATPASDGVLWRMRALWSAGSTACFPLTQRCHLQHRESHYTTYTQTWRNLTQFVSLSKRLNTEWPHLLFTSCLGLLLTNRAWSLLRSWDALGERKNRLLSGDLFLLKVEVHFTFYNRGGDGPAYLLWSPLDLRASFSPCLTFWNGLVIFSFATLFPWILCSLMPDSLAHCKHKKISQET